LSSIVRLIVKVLKGEPFKAPFRIRPKTSSAKTKTLFKANTDSYRRAIRVTENHPDQGLPSSVLTTDFLVRHLRRPYKLQKLGAVSNGDHAWSSHEQVRPTPLRWVAVLTSPIANKRRHLKEQRMCAQIYKVWTWSTVCSAIVCWALLLRNAETCLTRLLRLALAHSRLAAALNSYCRSQGSKA